MNLGTYHLRALMDDAASAAPEYRPNWLRSGALRAAEIQSGRGFRRRTANAKHGYRPGDHVTGTVRANYFFGKPVDHGEVTVKATGMDVAEFEAGSAEGKTDADGA